MTGYQLHDSETEEILGSVMLKQGNEDELIEAWKDFNKLEEHEQDSSNVDDFVEWFNINYESQIERFFIEFIQH